MKSEFDAKIKKVPGMDGAYVEIPFEVTAAFGRRRMPVDVTFDEVPHQNSLMKIKMPCRMIGLRKEICQQIGKQIGDIVHITMEKRVL